MYRRVLSALAAAALLTLPASAAPGHSAAAAVVMDAGSGRVLYAHNAHEPRLIASITKLMTALVAVESTPDLTAVVTVDGAWLEGAEGSSIYLAPGDQLTLETLLYGMLLESGNDAAMVVAGYCAGDVDTFVEWMNLRAADLGMADSHFENPSGLNAEGHCSSAYDMALAAQACLEHEVIARIVATKSITLEGRTFYNHNKLLSLYDGCVGMKTGYTQLAGRTLVSCAQRGEQRVIVVTLGDPNDWEDHMALLDYAFGTWPLREILPAGEEVTTLPVTDGLVPTVEVEALESISYPLTPEEEQRVEVTLSLPQQAAAPLEEGAIAGEARATLDGEVIGSTYLVYAQQVYANLFETRSPLERILDFFGGWLAGPAQAALPAEAWSAVFFTA